MSGLPRSNSALPHRSRLVVAALALVGLATSCAEPPRERPNVILIVVDTLRADRISAYGYERPTSGFLPIHMPKNTGAGIILAGISTVLGFALIWHMWLLAGVSFFALLAVAIGHTFNYDRDYHIPADEVAGIEAERTRMLANHV